MKIRHLTQMPHAYTIEAAPGGLCSVWLCRQIDAYTSKDGIREYDIEVRVVQGITPAPELEEDIRLRFEAWWTGAAQN